MTIVQSNVDSGSNAVGVLKNTSVMSSDFNAMSPIGTNLTIRNVRYMSACRGVADIAHASN